MELPGICVLVGENIEGAIRILRQKCERSRLKEDVQRHRFYLSRSERRREKDRKAEIRLCKRGIKYES
jgi:ribosomal protein S21